MASLKGPMRAKKSRPHWDLFDRMLAVQEADLKFRLRGVCSVPWADFFLNPRRLRGSDFLMRWSQGVWSEHWITEGVNASGEYLAIPYGLSSVAPDNDPRETELYFERLDAAGVGDRKRPDILVFRKCDGAAALTAVAAAGGEKELPFIPEEDPRMQVILSRAILAVECEQSLWVARRMPAYGRPLKPMARLLGKMGLPKGAVLPTIIVKEEDRQPLREWQAASGVPIHIWHVFYDLAYGIALDRIEELIKQGLIEPKEQVYQAPGGATTRKRTYGIYYQYAYPLGESTQEPSLVAAHIYGLQWAHSAIREVRGREHAHLAGRPATTASSRRIQNGANVMRIRHQVLPSSGPEREALRTKGQFWTPQWVAEAMVAYVVAQGKHTVFDPAVGGGAFLLAALSLSHELGREIALSGAEIDPSALKEALASGLSEGDLANVTIGDFLATPASTRLSGIVANPPYIRHHRLSAEKKAALRAYGASIIGEPLDGRAGYHVYFLLKALQLLEKHGRLAFIMPADTCEGVSAPILWRWITSHYNLEAVITFSPDATPFPGVDTNPLVFFIRNSVPEKHLLWVRCNQAESEDLKAWALCGPKAGTFPSLNIIRRELHEAVGIGLSRPPIEDAARGPELRTFARTMRGIASGANEFFLFTRARAVALGLPQEFLLSAIVRTRDVPGVELTRELLDRLDADGRPTLLLSPDGRPLQQFPHRVREYLEKGEKEGISNGILVKTRQPWYKMETRKVPPFLFAYLGRRNARFVRNAAGVVPLTGFLCVYPRRQDSAFLSELWAALSDPRTIANLVMVGKSYGEGCIKVEPRALERLMIPKAVVEEVGLDEAPEPTQHRFSFAELA